MLQVEEVQPAGVVLPNRDEHRVWRDLVHVRDRVAERRSPLGTLALPWGRKFGGLAELERDRSAREGDSHQDGQHPSLCLQRCGEVAKHTVELLDGVSEWGTRDERCLLHPDQFGRGRGDGLAGSPVAKLRAPMCSDREQDHARENGAGAGETGQEPAGRGLVLDIIRGVASVWGR